MNATRPVRRVKGNTKCLGLDLTGNFGSLIEGGRQTFKKTVQDLSIHTDTDILV